jgi:plastocyanin
MKRIVGFIAVVVLLAGACGKDKSDDAAKSGSQTTVTTAAKGPLTFKVAVDGATPEGKNIQLAAYFPGGLKVHPGDTVLFENKSSQAPHTVSFGINSDRSNSPAPLTKAAAFNPAVFGPCVSPAAPSRDLVACPEPPAAQLPPYAGTGYWNSGVLAPAAAPAGTKQVAVKFAESTPTGTYNYACILHAFMGGSVTVVSPEETRDNPDDVATSAAKSAADAATAAAAIPDPAAPGAGQVVSGWGSQVAAVNRFLPSTVEIKAGETVTWKATSQFEPHTVTFEPPFTNPEDPRVPPPSGAKAGGSYTAGFTNSGIFGPKPPFPSDSFSLRFPKAGEYNYVCALHPGMKGTVKAT